MKCNCVSPNVTPNYKLKSKYLILKKTLICVTKKERPTTKSESLQM